MKTLILSFILLFTSGVNAGNFYIGGMAGKSNLNYDVEGKVWEYMATEETAVYTNAAVHALGGYVSVDSDKIKRFEKVFIGYNANENLGFEIFHVSTGNYNVSARTRARYRNSFNQDGNIIDTTGRISANADAEANADANIKGTGFRINGYLPVSNNFSMLFGFGIMRAKVEAVSTYSSNVTVEYGGELSIDQQAFFGGRITSPRVVENADGSRSYADSGTSFFSKVYAIPVLSVGMTYDITDSFVFRGELETYGLQFNGASITAVSIGLAYNFK